MPPIPYPWRTLKARIWLVLALSILPLAAAMVWDYQTQYAQQRALAESRVLHVLSMAQRAEQIALHDVSTLMGIMARANEMTSLDPEACRSLAGRLMAANPAIANLGAVDPQGQVICSGLPVDSSDGAGAFGSQRWFLEARSATTATLSRGEVIRSNPAAEPRLMFGYPLLNAAAPRGTVLFIALTPLFFDRVLSGMIGLEPDWRFLLQTANGLALASNHSHNGATPNAVSDLNGAWNTLLDQQPPLRELTDIDGRPRLFGVARLQTTEPALLLVAAAPLHLSIAQLQSTLWWRLFLLLGVLLLSMGLIRWQIHGLLERWTQRLQRALNQVADGQFDVRLDRPTSIEDLAQINHGFNAMAEQLAHKQAENMRLLTTIEQSPLSVVITSPGGAIEYVNRKFTEISGYTAHEALGQNPRLLNHGLTPKAVYDNLWSTLTRGEVWSGEFINTRKDGSIYTELATIAPVFDARGQLSHYVAVKEDITQRKATEARLDRLSNFDVLTELPNRRLLRDRLGQAALSASRSRQWAALLLLDVDRFKLLNESQGHDVGDRLLQEMALRLRASVRQVDTVARLGDDEFAVMVESLGRDALQAAQEVERIGHHIHEALVAPWTIVKDSPAYRPALSVGITLFSGDLLSVDAILKQAELALSASKEAGGNVMRFFDPAVERQVHHRALLEQSLQQALEHNEFRLLYQPQVDGQGRVRGFEGLIRWLRADGTMVSPAEFIPIAETSGLIVPLGRWVIETGLTQLRDWLSAGAPPSLEVSLNVSARQFKHPDFVEHVRAPLERLGIAGHHLVLELTETVVLDDLEFVAERMRELRQLGVRFSLDDFGTGYSALAYLQKLPLQQLKIDQGFVRAMLDDPRSMAIVRAILALSEALDLEVVAEGVETAEQSAVLLQAGCDLLQGYLYGRPASQWADWSVTRLNGHALCR